MVWGPLPTPVWEPSHPEQRLHVGVQLESGVGRSAVGGGSKTEARQVRTCSVCSQALSRGLSQGVAMTMVGRSRAAFETPGAPCARRVSGACVGALRPLVRGFWSAGAPEPPQQAQHWLS